MKIHELKTWPEYFQTTLDGTKRFEFRKNDRDFKVGDILDLQEWDPEKGQYTGRALAVMVLLLLEDVFGLPEGLCIMSIQHFGLERWIR